MLTAALAAYWQRHCAPHRLGLISPIQCGNNRELYTQWIDLDQTPDEINPLYFQTPLVPPIAAEREGRRVELEKVWQTFEQLRHQRDFVLIEAWGGLGSPMTRETTTADLAWDWRLPVVLVVPVTPGAIAQAVTNVALANQSRVHLKGIVLNCVHPCHKHEFDNWLNIDLIQTLTNKPVLGCIPHLKDLTDVSKLAQVASSLDLERLMPLI